MLDGPEIGFEKWLVAILKILTGSTLSGRVWNNTAKVVFLCALAWHEWILPLRLEKAAGQIPKVPLPLYMSERSSCPVHDNTNTSIQVLGFTVSQGRYSGGNGYFIGPTYSLSQWKDYIEMPSGALVVLMVIRLCGWKYLNPFLPQARNLKKPTKWLNSAWFLAMFVVHLLTEVVLYVLIFHAIKNITGYETPKALWAEPEPERLFNAAGEQALAVASRHPNEPPKELQHQIFVLTCRENRITHAQFWNYYQWLHKMPADRMEILRFEQSYHTGWRLRLAMHVSSAMVVLSVVLGVLSQALDNSVQDWRKLPRKLATSSPPSPMRSPREPAPLPPSLQIEGDEFARVLARAEPARAGRPALRFTRSRQT
jgi:hypothetical protein